VSFCLASHYLKQIHFNERNRMKQNLFIHLQLTRNSFHFYHTKNNQMYKRHCYGNYKADTFLFKIYFIKKQINSNLPKAFANGPLSQFKRSSSSFKFKKILKNVFTSESSEHCWLLFDQPPFVLLEPQLELHTLPEQLHCAEHFGNKIR
jgi:hypothetical protein